MQRFILVIFVLFLSTSSVLAVEKMLSPNNYLKKITLATTEWPPYVGKNLPDHGYVYQMVKQALNSKGYDAQIDFMPWEQAKKVGQQTQHGFFPAYQNELTDAVTACSIPFDGGPIGLFRRKSSNIRLTVDNPSKNQVEAFQELAQYKFGVVEGYVNTSTFDNMNDLQKLPAKSDFENLQQLQEKAVDLVIMDVFVGLYLIEKNPTLFREIEFMGPALEQKNLYLCVGNPDPNQYPAILADFNAALISMKASGKLDEMMEQYKL
jgi:polar amino acid transport system substrate-binding protein